MPDDNPVSWFILTVFVAHMLRVFVSRAFRELRWRQFEYKKGEKNESKEKTL